MARAGRIDAPGAIHHVMTRGMERGRIFRDRADYKSFLQRAGLIFKESKTRCFAWALMPNHIHFLLQTGTEGLSLVMQRLLTGHTVTFNHRWHRTGHLLQGRFKSILCEKETYFLSLVRYIHLNPVRAGLCDGMAGLATYPWSGHGALVGKESTPWQDTEAVLERFAPRVQDAREGYKRFCREGLELPAEVIPETSGARRLLVGGWESAPPERLARGGVMDERIAGSDRFIQTVLHEADERERARSQLRRAGVTVDKIIDRVARAAKLPVRDLTGSGKRPAQVWARAMLCHWLVERLGMTETAVARRLGITQPTVSQSVTRGRRFVAAGKLRWS